MYFLHAVDDVDAVSATANADAVATTAVVIVVVVVVVVALVYHLFSSTLTFRNSFVAYYIL